VCKVRTTPANALVRQHKGVLNQRVFCARAHALRHNHAQTFIHMSQVDVNDFVQHVQHANFTQQEMLLFVMSKQIAVDSGCSKYGWSALHGAVAHGQCSFMIAALLAVGAGANVKAWDGCTPIWSAVYASANMLEMLIEGGGSVNETDNIGEAPLIAVMKSMNSSARACLDLLLARPELDLTTNHSEMTAVTWAAQEGRQDFVAAIADEQKKRVRWTAIRAAWVVAATARCGETSGSEVD
jgi:hypothetical protein